MHILWHPAYTRNLEGVCEGQEDGSVGEDAFFQADMSSIIHTILWEMALKLSSGFQV